jgi:hypothetical protein
MGHRIIFNEGLRGRKGLKTTRRDLDGGLTLESSSKLSGGEKTKEAERKEQRKKNGKVPTADLPKTAVSSHHFQCHCQHG